MRRRGARGAPRWAGQTTLTGGGQPAPGALLVGIDPLLTLLTSGSSEQAYVVMAHFQLIQKRMPKILEDDFKYFFLRCVARAALRRGSSGRASCPPGALAA